MYTIIPEDLEVLCSLVSISAVRKWCIITTQMQKKNYKLHQNTVTLEAVCFYSFIYMYTKTPEKLEPLLQIRYHARWWDI